jgi:hypothetical protein
VPDWITDFEAFTGGLPTAAPYRLWSGITAVSGALERRCWANVAHSDLFPNLYTLLVGKPGSGKSQAIIPVARLWTATKQIHVAPDNVTSAALVDSLAEADRKIITPDGLVEYHSLAIACPELGVLIPQQDAAFMSIMNHLYDNPDAYREKRRTLNRECDIIQPQITFLAGTQPGFMNELFPESAWTMGFTSRIIMVYSGETPHVRLFGGEKPSAAARIRLLETLTAMTELRGQFLFTDRAVRAITEWHDAGMPPVPDHSKLANYNPRRIIHVLKLCMISAVSRALELVITHEDVARALDWLLAAERTMPDVFRQMVGRSDQQVIQELHIFAWREYAKARKPVHEALLYKFLSTQTDSGKIRSIMETAERSNMLMRVGGTATFMPKPRNEHGVE